MTRIEIGKIVNTHGLKGEAKIESWSDFDAIRYKKGNQVRLEKGDEFKDVTVRSFRMHKGYALVAFEECADLTAIEAFKGWIITIDQNDRHTLPKGKYYFDELIGLNAYNQEGQQIGTVISVEETNGAQNNLRIQMLDQKEFLIPNLPPFIESVDLDQQKIILKNYEGLL